jgi:hypothetical protein
MLDCILYDADWLREVLSMYLTGMPILEISVYMDTSVEELNNVLDKYAPYL